MITLQMTISPGHLARLQEQTMCIGRSKQCFRLFFVDKHGFLGETARREGNMFQSKPFRTVPPLPYLPYISRRLFLFRFRSNPYNWIPYLPGFAGKNNRIRKRVCCRNQRSRSRLRSSTIFSRRGIVSAYTFCQDSHRI
jgi:hypothetical protein